MSGKHLNILCCFFVIPVAILTGCSLNGKSVTVKATENTDYHSVCPDISVDEFNSLGFELGDSCSIIFSNGYTLDDVPYYNGYYSKTGSPVIVAYPGFDTLDIAFCSGDPMWEVSGCKEGDTVTIKLQKSGKYRDVQDTMDMVYSNEISDYPDDISFANFRAINAGNILSDSFFRGASPVDNKLNRAPVCGALIKEYGIQYILDLSDNEEKLTGFLNTDDPGYDHIKELYQDGNIMPLGLSASYRTDKFRSSLAEGLRHMMEHKGSYYIHCLEGKDRTGFVCMLLEALAGASYEEMEADYMKTYDNYYGITKESDPDKYDIILDLKFNDMAYFLENVPEGSDPKIADYRQGAIDYLLESGMTEEEINAFILFLTSKEI